LFFFAPHPQVFFQNVVGNWPATSGLIFGIAMASLAYTGVETVSQLSEETKRPSVNAPRALILMIVVVLVLFSGISVAAFSTMTPSELALGWARDPVAGIAQGLATTIVPGETIAGLFLAAVLKALPILVAILAATILIIATNAGLMGVSRLTFALGKFRLIPSALSGVHSRFKTPYKSIILFSSVAILLLVPGFFGAGTFAQLGRLYVFGSLLAFALAHASILRLRIKHPELPRPFKLRGNIKFRGHELPITAILGLVATSVIWLMVVITQPYARWIGLSWMAFGAIGYFVFRHRNQLPLIRTAREVRTSID